MGFQDFGYSHIIALFDFKLGAKEEVKIMEPGQWWVVLLLVIIGIPVTIVTAIKRAVTNWLVKHGWIKKGEDKK